MKERGLGERGPEGPESEPRPDYRDIKAAILTTWQSFSATTVNRHTQIYGPAKTLEVVECAARLGKLDINKVLETKLQDWSAPRMGDRTEIRGHRIENETTNLTDQPCRHIRQPAPCGAFFHRRID